MSNLPTGWIEIGFEEAVDTVSDRGFRIKQKDYLPSGKLPVVDQGEALIGGFTDILDAQVISHTPVIVFGDHTRRFKFVKFPFAVGADGVKLFSPVPIWKPEFLFLQLGTIDLENRGYGRHYQHLRKESLFLAPFKEQTRIVAKLEELLSDLDAGVVELRAAQKKLAQYRQSLLKAAVDGSLTAEWRKNNPPTETGAELLERILKERHTRWEAKQLAKFKEQDKAPPKDWQKKYPSPVEPDTTHLPELPTSWIWASVDQSTAESLIGLDRGQEQQSSTAAFGYIKMNNVSMHGNIDLKNITRVNATPEEVDKYSVALNDVLFNTRNSLELVGKTGLVGTLDGITLYNNNLMRLRFDGVLKPAFACFQMCGPEFRSRLERVKKATTSVAAVYAKDLFPLAMAIPPINEQNEILRILDLAMAGISTQQFEIERSLKQATAQRQNIFRAAFAGQLVPQDPNDEPASVLLERIRAERAAQAEPKARGRKKVAA